jgi:competence protein ComEC
MGLTGSAVLVLAIGWSAGIALGAVLDLTIPMALTAAAAAFVAAILAPSPGLRVAALGLMAMLLGQGRLAASIMSQPPDHLATYAGDVVLSGRVVEAPLPRGGRVEVVLDVERVADAHSADRLTALAEPLPRVLLRAPAVQASYGDRIETRGRLARPRSRPGWPLAEILARRGIGWVIDVGGVRVVEAGGPGLIRMLATARGLFEANTRAALPEPHSSLVGGIVFGARGSLPPELRAAMSASGTSHLTAVSGANVAMVAGALMILAAPVVGRAPASAVAIAGVVLYTLLVGAPPSALRAATMATFALVAQGLGRQTDAVVGLSVAAAALLGWDPGLAFDLGFQLSVAATAGLILLAPAIERGLTRLPRPVRDQVAIAVAAQLATLPLVVGTFQRISLVALPANVVAAPTIVPIMGLGAALAVLGSLPGIGVLLGWGAWLVTGTLLAVIQGAADLPGAVVAVGRWPAWLPLAWYAVLGCWAAAGSADLRSLGIRRAGLQTVALAAAAVMIGGLLLGWSGVSRSAAVEIALLDVDSPAVFVRTPDGRSALVMTAAPRAGLAASVGGQLDFWESSVDVVIGPDGIRTGLDLLEADPSAAAPIHDVVGDHDAATGGERPDGLSARPIEPGTRVDVADGVSIQVVDARQAGQRPVLDLAVLVGGIAVLLPGPGAPSMNWAGIAPDAATVAALPSSAVVWARVQPPRRWLLLTGEPALERARGDSGVPFLVRRDHGLVSLSVDGDNVEVRTERCAAGSDCRLELPPPSRRALLSPSAANRGSGGGSSVQSDLSDDGR